MNGHIAATFTEFFPAGTEGSRNAFYQEWREDAFTAIASTRAYAGPNGLMVAALDRDDYLARYPHGRDHKMPTDDEQLDKYENRLAEVTRNILAVLLKDTRARAQLTDKFGRTSGLT